MEWDGRERRKISVCPLHENLSKHIEQQSIDIAIIKEKVIAVDTRINGSIDHIEKHIENGSKWRMSIIGVSVALLLTVISGIIGWTKTTTQVEVNTGRLGEIERLLPRIVPNK